MTWRVDLDALRERQEALVAFTVGADQTLALVRKMGGALQSTWGGEPIPQTWTAYAFQIVNPPDVGGLEEDY